MIVFMDDLERLAQARAIATGAGLSQEHLKFVLDFYDRRETELLAIIKLGNQEIDFLMGHSGAQQIAALEAKLAETVDVDVVTELMAQRIYDYDFWGEKAPRWHAMNDVMKHPFRKRAKDLLDTLKTAGYGLKAERKAAITES